MSIELPEAYILAKQMDILIGKTISNYILQDYEKLQKIGFINKDISVFDQLRDQTIRSISSRGNTILIGFDLDLNLILAPEYGGKILFHKDKKTIPKKIHFLIHFTDQTALSVRLTSMGCINVVNGTKLKENYMYQRDFSNLLSPLEENFSLTNFSKMIGGSGKNMKACLVGKDAILVGISNSAFQDIIYRAKLHPKRKGNSLSEEEQTALFTAINDLIQERIKLGGKDQFIDLFGKKGKYVPRMGPNKKDTTCSECGVEIEKIAFGGGQVYLCPECQYLE